MKVSIIGLGSMGLGAAINCYRAGHDVVGSDLNPAALKKFELAGGRSSDQLADAANSDALLIFVVNANQAEQILSESLLTSLAPDAVVINCVTITPAAAQGFAERVERIGLHYLDAPVSGGAAKAMTGDMSVMGSGSPRAFERATPLLDAIASKVFTLGTAAGDGSRMKTINQLLAGVHIAAAAEAMALAGHLQMDLHRVLEVISECAGTSWMFENRGPHIANGDYAPLSSVDIFVKDLGIVSDAAANHASIPMTRTALELFANASKTGMGQMDDSAVALLLARAAGVRLPGDPTAEEHA